MNQLDVKFAALGDSTRRAILARLALGEATVMEIAKPFAMSQPSISAHLKMLERAGLIIRRVDGSKRPCRLALNALDEVEVWLGDMRKILEANFDRLDAVLATMPETK